MNVNQLVMIDRRLTNDPRIRRTIIIEQSFLVINFTVQFNKHRIDGYAKLRFNVDRAKKKRFSVNLQFSLFESLFEPSRF